MYLLHDEQYQGSLPCTESRKFPHSGHLFWIETPSIILSKVISIIGYLIVYQRIMNFSAANGILKCENPSNY
jgi:hypothetical protein